MSDDCDDDKIVFYEGDYSEILDRPDVVPIIVSASSGGSPLSAMTSDKDAITTAVDAKECDTAFPRKTKTPAADEPFVHVEFETLFRNACVQHRSLTRTGAQIANMQPGCSTSFPTVSEAVLVDAKNKSEESAMKRMVERYLEHQGHEKADESALAASFSSMSLLTNPHKLLSSMVLPLKWVAGRSGADDAAQENEAAPGDRRTGGDDLLLNASLTRECVEVLTNLIHKYTHAHEAIALQAVGMGVCAWSGWLASMMDEPQHEQEPLRFIHRLPLSQLDILFRIMEHGKVLERVVDEEQQTHSGKAALPSIIILCNAYGETDKDYCISHLGSRISIASLQALMNKYQREVDECTRLAKICKANNQTAEALSQLRTRKVREKQLREVEPKLQLAETSLHGLEDARHTRAVMKVIDSNKNAMKGLRTQPLGDGREAEDVLDDWADEMDRFKEVDAAFADAAAAANQGMEGLDDDDLLAELAAYPDAGGSGGGTEAAVVGTPSKTNDESMRQEAARDDLAVLKARLASLNVGSSADDATTVQKPTTEEDAPLTAA